MYLANDPSTTFPDTSSDAEPDAVAMRLDSPQAPEPRVGDGAAPPQGPDGAQGLDGPSSLVGLAEGVPHVEVVAFPGEGNEHLGNPVGSVYLEWQALDEHHYGQEVARWLRFDRHGIRPGTIVTVRISASRQRGETRHEAACTLLVTYDPADVCEFAVGDAEDPQAWTFGLLAVGAVLGA